MQTMSSTSQTALNSSWKNVSGNIVAQGKGIFSHIRFKKSRALSRRFGVTTHDFGLRLAFSPRRLRFSFFFIMWKGGSLCLGKKFVQRVPPAKARESKRELVTSHNAASSLSSEAYLILVSFRVCFGVVILPQIKIPSHGDRSAFENAKRMRREKFYHCDHDVSKSC